MASFTGCSGRCQRYLHSPGWEGKDCRTQRDQAPRLEGGRWQRGPETGGQVALTLQHEDAEVLSFEKERESSNSAWEKHKDFLEQNRARLGITGQKTSSQREQQRNDRVGQHRAGKASQ